jgi:hypothetical protein
MSVLDRVKRARTDTTDSGQTSPDPSITPEVKSLVAKRINLVVTELIDFAEQNKKESAINSHVWILKSLFSAMSDELNSASDEVLGHWIEQFGKLLEWCGSGDDSVLPPEVIEYIYKNHREMLAIEA